MPRELLKHIPGEQRHLGLSYEARRMAWSARAMCGAWLLCPWDFDMEDPRVKKEAARWLIPPWPSRDEPDTHGGPVDADPVDLSEIDPSAITCTKCRDKVLGRLYEQALKEKK